MVIELPATPTTAAAFGTGLKRFYRKLTGVKPKASVSVGSSRTGGVPNPPDDQFVTLRSPAYGVHLPQALFQAALDVVYPGATQPTGNIARNMIALWGREWREVEKLIYSREDARREAESAA